MTETVSFSFAAPAGVLVTLSRTARRVLAGLADGARAYRRYQGLAEASDATPAQAAKLARQAMFER